MAEGATLFVTSWGGEYAEAQTRAYFSPFAKAHGHTLTIDTWGGDLDRVRAMLARQHYTTNLIDAEEDETEVGCTEGLLHRIDVSRLELSVDELVPGAIHECGIATSAWSMIFAYDRDVLPDGPQQWADFWDTDRFRGARGLYRGPEGTLEIALMADGVARDAIYPTLSQTAGVARAFDKLTALSANIQWWEAGDQAPQSLVDREVIMTSGWHGRLIRYQTKHPSLSPQWQGQIMHFDFWVVPRGHPGTYFAYQFIKYATAAGPQADMANLFPYGPVRLDALPLVAPQVLPHLPTAPANRESVLLADAAFWVSNRDALTERFAAWLSAHPSDVVSAE